jgi:hypothetical protein
MSWRESLLRSLAPGLFAGVSFGDWLAVLRENHFALDPGYWLRATCTSLNSLVSFAVLRPAHVQLPPIGPLQRLIVPASTLPALARGLEKA